MKAELSLSSPVAHVMVSFVVDDALNPDIWKVFSDYE
jgi:hypothetical protein